MLELGWVAAALALVSAVFCGVYASDRKSRWCAIVPALGTFTLLAALVTHSALGPDPVTHWASILVLSAGCTIIAGVVDNEEVGSALFIVAACVLAVGLLMTPLPLVTRVLFVSVLALAVAVATLWGRGYRQPSRPH